MQINYISYKLETNIYQYNMELNFILFIIEDFKYMAGDKKDFYIFDEFHRFKRYDYTYLSSQLS
jgi:hypothetical protein